MNAQSSGLAISVHGAPKSGIPNGLGSEFVFWSTAYYLNDKGAILSPDQSNRSRRVCLCKIDQANKEFRQVCLIPGIGRCGLGAPGSAEWFTRAIFRSWDRERLLCRSVICRGEVHQ